MQKQVSEFSKTANFLCGPSNHSCSCPRTWKSISMTKIGHSNLQTTALPATFAYDIPDTVPDNAKEVLVYVYFWSGNSNPQTLSHFKIYTEEGDHKYEQYVALRSYRNTNFFNTNTDNLWFPMPSNRKIFMEVPHRHGTAGGEVYVIGHRSM